MVRRVRRGRARRAAESFYGLLLLLKAVVAGALVVALLAAGVWISWPGVRAALGGSGAVRGSMAVGSCSQSSCVGSFTPSSGGGVRTVRVDRLATAGAGERFAVAVRPGSSAAVRTGVAGVLFALRSVAGALLMSALALWLGLGLRRWALVSAVLGAAVVAAPFAPWG